MEAIHFRLKVDKTSYTRTIIIKDNFCVRKLLTKGTSYGLSSSSNGKRVLKADSGWLDEI